MFRWLHAAVAWMATNPGMVETVDAKIYRVRNYYLAVGAFGTIFFAAFGICSVVAALWNVDGSFAYPKAFAIVVGVFWACWWLLSLWLIGLYHRGRLYVGNNWVRQRGCFLTHLLRLDEVLTARWRIWPQGGSLVLRGRAGKLVIEFSNFSCGDQAELIEIFRIALAEGIQEGWSKFESRFAGPPVEPEVDPEVRLADVIRRDYQFLLRSTGLVWACYLLSLIPVSPDSIARGVLCGCFAGAMIYSPVPAVVAIIDAIRYRFARFVVLALIAVSLTILSWWHAIHWPVAGR